MGAETGGEFLTLDSRELKTPGFESGGDRNTIDSSSLRG